MAPPRRNYINKISRPSDGSSSSGSKNSRSSSSSANSSMNLNTPVPSNSSIGRGRDRGGDRVNIKSTNRNRNEQTELSPTVPSPPFETDPITLVRRQRQIDFGKITQEYRHYTTVIPKESRKSCHPATPNRYQKCSRRSWDGQIRVWRMLLHVWDAPDRKDDKKGTSIQEEVMMSSPEAERNGALESLQLDISFNPDQEMDSP